MTLVRRAAGRSDERRLLHHGGPDGHWGNLGLWAESSDYASACTALADRVGRAAALGAGQRVLSLACGAGDELLRWAQHFAAGPVLGLEINPALAEAARRNARRQSTAASPIQVLTGPVLAAAGDTSADTRPPTLLQAGSFDAVLCVDAAYHLSPRAAFLAQAWHWLKPGGMLAYTDLTFNNGSSNSHTPARLRAAARLCSVRAADLLPLAAQWQALADAGFVPLQAEPLDDAVLGGFARFVPRQRAASGWLAWHPAWLRPVLTAALIPRLRSAGLGYALLAARKPGPNLG